MTLLLPLQLYASIDYSLNHLASSILPTCSNLRSVWHLNICMRAPSCNTDLLCWRFLLGIIGDVHSEHHLETSQVCKLFNFCRSW
ncbi:unnamed protein product [Calypogeia fissa]